MRSHRPTRITRSVALAGLAAIIAACGTEAPEVSDAPDPDADSSAPQEAAAEEEAATTDEADASTEHEDQVADDDHDDAGHQDPVASDDAGAPTTVSDHGDTRVVEVEMLEFAYEPSSIEIAAGEEVVLRFINEGQVEHEAMVGDAHMQEEFAASDDHGSHGDQGGGHHGDVMAVTVAPGESVDLPVEISEPGEIFIGCHLPGHYDAGMQATLMANA